MVSKQQRVDEIDSEIEKLYEERDAATQGLGFSNIHEWKAVIKPYHDKIATLSREQRMIMPYELQEPYHFGDVMTLKKFIACVKVGGFLNSDGDGFYMKEGKQTNIPIHPSDIAHKSIREGFTHIIWFNK
jgi:hypothetical protein